MVSDLLRHFQLAAILQIRRDAGRAKGMIADPRFDAETLRRRSIPRRAHPQRLISNQSRA
jgi:hypothetical protein